ncbi:MAG: hypothetical protein NZ926_00270 [Candidatus Methanomethylicia archaeon]|nr:hypothetical protein [Candidatus Methanomethylicia archaeon]MCX8168870.1 hypothetical protein [Candidatus Methanomethylicia archaeon]MDW7988602.1 hypothetical protein [Nitrososphaerota archaeon]
MKGETFLISSLIISLMIMFLGVHIISSPIKLKPIGIEILYCQSINILIDKYISDNLKFYPLNSSYINFNINRFVNTILKYKPNNGIYINRIDYLIQTIFHYNDSFSQVYFKCEFNIKIVSVHFKRIIVYNLTLLIPNYILNNSFILLHYLLIENGILVDPINIDLWFYYNNSWIKISTYNYTKNSILIPWTTTPPCKIMLGLTSLMGIRITAMIKL